MKIGFTASIERGDRESSKFAAVEAFDDYFDVWGRKFTVINVDYATVRENDTPDRNLLLNALKIVSYFTLIIPLIMLIGKIIARSYYNFTYEPNTEDLIDELKIVTAGIRSKQRDARMKIKRIKTAQSAVRGFIERRAFQERKKDLKKKLFRSQKSILELGNTEKSFSDSLISSMNLMQNTEFKSCLIESKNEMILTKFCDDYLHLITKNIKLIDSLDQITNLENSDEIENDIKHIIEVFSGKEFEGYMLDLVKISQFQKGFESLIDMEKVNSLAKKYKVQIFDPCFISIQRLMRYPMMLENTLGLIGKINLPEHQKELEVVIGKAKSLIMSYNRKVKIEELAGYIQRYKELEDWKPAYLKKVWIVKSKALKELLGKINFYLESNMNNLLIEREVNPKSDEGKIRSLQQQLLAISKRH